MSNAKNVIGAIADGLKDGEEFHFEFFNKSVGCQISSWNGENETASCINIWFDGSTTAYISNSGMSLEYAALMVCSSIVDHAVERGFSDADTIHREFWETVDNNPWVNAIWMENANNRKKEEEE